MANGISAIKNTIMKKTLITALLISIAMGLSAQIAIRGGINYSDVTINGVTNVSTGSKIGFHAGLQGHLGIGNVLSIRPALLYNIKGAKVDQTGASESKSLHYLEAPINLGLKLGTNAFSIILEGGPYFGYLINTGDGLFNNIDKSDWGANFGAVLELDNIGIGANYSNSLSDVNGSDQIDQTFRLKNGNLAAFIYFKF